MFNEKQLQSMKVETLDNSTAQVLVDQLLLDCEVANTDEVLDKFYDKMRKRLVLKIVEGRIGWQQCTLNELSEKLSSSLQKGKFIDVANYAMFMYFNSEQEED